jgi:hypothetical protein
MVCFNSCSTKTHFGSNTNSDSAIRLCVDLTHLNNSVQREQFNLPIIDQLLARLAGATVFSQIDCTSGFHQVELTGDSMPLTMFTTPFGRWCYRRLPYGISSASEVYQRKILQVIGDADGTATLVDDVLIYGATQRQHDERLRVVMDCLRQHVTLNDKSTFSVSEIQFAGHVISLKGISPSPDRVRAVVDMPPSSTYDVFLEWSTSWRSSPAILPNSQHRSGIFCKKTESGCGTSFIRWHSIASRKPSRRHLCLRSTIQPSRQPSRLTVPHMVWAQYCNNSSPMALGDPSSTHQGRLTTSSVATLSSKRNAYR